MKILCVGEMMVDILVRPVEEISFQNDTKQIERISISSGGDANNNAIDLARLGHDVTYIGRIGFDSMGDYVVSVAKSAGINMDYAHRSTTSRQATSVVLVNADGNRTFLQSAGTSAEFCFEDCDLTVLDRVDALQISAIYHLPRFDGEGAVKLLKAAKERGVITSMDISTDRTGRWNDLISCCCPYLDYFLPSIEQASAVVKRRDPNEIAEYFLSKGAKNIAIKLGSQGSYFRNAQKAFWVGTYSGLNVVETTGAGDAFCSGFLTGVGERLSYEECMTMATAASSCVIQAVGATAGAATRDELQKFMETHPPLEIVYAEK